MGFTDCGHVGDGAGWTRCREHGFPCATANTANTERGMTAAGWLDDCTA